MNRLQRRLGTLAFALAAGTTALVAQETGTLAVTVRNKEGKPLAKAKVTAASPTQIGGAKSALTDEQGRVRLLSLYPGDFSLTVEAEGYQSGTLKGVRVSVATVTPAEVKLVPISETIVVVTASAATIDPTTTTSSARLTTDVLDALPTQRTYTDFVRFAPGVIASPDSNGNFAVAGSLSRDNTGTGGARNNTYILDGVDTTNPQTGGALSRFNSEIIQEQEIKTGGIQADVAARGGGLVSNVVTKSGSNTWAGSLNYYVQNSSLVASRKAGVLTKDSKFSSFDTAFTLGGPILKDRWWFFASVQKQNTTTDGAFQDTATPTPVAKNAEQDDLLGFFKTTLQINPNNSLELSLTQNKSKDVSLGLDTAIPGQDLDRDRTQRITNLRYEGVFSDWVVTAKAFTFGSDATPKPKVFADNIAIIYPNAPFNGLPSSGSLQNYQKAEGGLGWYTKTNSERTGFSLDVSRFQGQLLGDHLFKAGVLSQEEVRTSNLQHSGSGSDYEYLPLGTANNLTWGDVVANFSGATWSDDAYVPGALDRVRTTNAALDAYLTGLGNDYNLIPFQTLAPGSTTKLLQYRITGLRYGNDAKVKRKALDYYLQDTWTLPGNQFTAYLGVRFNKDSYYADDGTKLHTTELNVAPRLGLTYNHKGENKLKLYATYGRYFEPIKLDMVTFAGSFANARVEQMYIPYQGAVGTYNAANWVTLRQRGGRETVDAALAPTLQSPYTDELRLGLERDLGHGITFEGTYSHREDKRIVEDFDLNLYTNPTALLPSATTLSRIQGVYGGTAAYWNGVFSSLAYPLSHFGYTAIPSNVNYVLANLIGAERKFDVINLSLRRSDTGDGWVAFVNYTHTKATGNSLSSGDADFQGDTPRLDPRMPWMNGNLSGSVDHQAKAYLSHTIKEGWAKGLTLGGSYTYVAGINYTRGLGNSGRILGGPFIAGFDAKPGTRRGPSFQQFDLRAKYDLTFAKSVKGEVFVDVFNALNRQTPTAVEESSNGVNGANPGDPIAWQNPRRFYLGARISF
jgi:hypothetical protein